MSDFLKKNWWWIVAFLAATGSLRNIISLLFPAFIIFVIISNLSKDSKSNRKSSTTTVSSMKLFKCNRLMKEYFYSNNSLRLSEGIEIKPGEDGYKSLNALYVFKDNDGVATLNEFRKSYPSTYDDLIIQCLEYFENPSAFSKTEEVKQEEKFEEKTTKKVKNMPTTIEKFIVRIDDLNIEIPHEEISNGLYEVTAYLRQINNIEKEFPDSKEKTKKLTQYYLPILVEILEQYKQLSGSARNHAEFSKTEDKLIKTIILINEALKTISYSLCQDYYTNLSVDMSTLETLLRKDGLVSDGTLRSVKEKVKSNE